MKYRVLAACEGALLVVDVAQGVEAQTLANVYLAIENNLEVLPVLNKIDLPSAETEKVRQEIEDIIGLDSSNAAMVSKKKGSVFLRFCNKLWIIFLRHLVIQAPPYVP